MPRTEGQRRLTWQCGRSWRPVKRPPRGALCAWRPSELPGARLRPRLAATPVCTDAYLLTVLL